MIALETHTPTATWQALPKVLLHEHLDGGLRPQTLLELCQAQGLTPPVTDADALGRWMAANAHSGSLERYLQGFSWTVQAMASASACERVAFEAAEDARLDGCVLAEFRMAPLLLEPLGLAPEAALEAMLAGLRRSPLASGLIVCAMRTDDPAHSVRAAQLAARYRDQGVVGFDLAGAERGFPATPHAPAFRVARDAGLGLTCHAGEADSGDRVLEAAQVGATRIGHGVHIMGLPGWPADPAWCERARDEGLHFEVCPSSNVHTGVVSRLSDHPIAAMLRAGLNVSCSTDNRLMSAVTLSGELSALESELGMTRQEIGQLMRNGAQASFLPAAVREAAAGQIAQAYGLT